MSCSKQEVAKDPPSVKPQLVIDLFNAIDNGNHETALAKILRLKDINNTVFLSELSLIEQHNLEVSKIQDKLDAGDIDGAIQLCSGAMIKITRNEPIAEIKTKLQTLNHVKSSVDAISNAQDSIQLARAGARLKLIANTYPPAADFAKIAEETLLRAREMMSRREKITIIDLSCELLSCPDETEKLRETLSAALITIAPDNILLIRNTEK